MRSISVTSWLVCSTVCCLASANPALISHLEDSMENSVRYSWNPTQGANVKITCKICGPRGLVLVWRKRCSDIKTSKDVLLERSSTQHHITQVLYSGSRCTPNATKRSEKDLFEIDSVYFAKLPPETINCRMACCGYLKIDALRSKPVATENRTNIMTGQPPDEVIWPEEMTMEDMNKIDWKFGSCRDTTTVAIMKVLPHDSIYIEVVVYSMVGITFLSVMGTFVVVYIVDYRSNIVKTARFQKWAQEEKLRRALHSCIRSSLLRQHGNTRASSEFEEFADVSTLKTFKFNIEALSRSLVLNEETLRLLKATLDIDMGWDPLRGRYLLAWLERLRQEWLPEEGLDLSTILGQEDAQPLKGTVSTTV